MLQLSHRMRAVAGLVGSGGSLADVGTDHGYIPVYLVKQGRIRHVIAADINEGPLARAREHILAYHLEDQIETRLSDGLREIRPGEVQSVVIAGMGGPLMVRILSDGQKVLEFCEELVLQPQSHIREVRSWLWEHGWQITAEDLVLEDEKFYPMMRVVRTGAGNGTDHCARGREVINESGSCDKVQDQAKESGSGARDREPFDEPDGISAAGISAAQLHELGLCYGPLLLRQKHPLLGSYLKREETLKLRVLQSLDGKHTEAAVQRRLELAGELELLHKARVFLSVDAVKH